MNQLSLLHRALHLPRPSPRRGHGFTAAAAAAAVIRARLSSPDPAPQQHPVRLAITAPHQESVKASVTTSMESNNNVAPREAAADGDGRTCELPTWALIGGMTAGVAAALLLSAGAGPAQALGPPEGPLVEEFWDNMRRYALYVVTVSTGVAYTVLQPIVELLKNPVTALLIVAVLAGSGFLVSQVLNAMVGNSDFIYRYE